MTDILKVKKGQRKEDGTQARAQDRDRARALLDGASDQDLVPKPADEVEEGAQDGEHERDADAPDAPRPRLRPPSPPPGSLHTVLGGKEAYFEKEYEAGQFGEIICIKV